MSLLRKLGISNTVENQPIEEVERGAEASTVKKLLTHLAQIGINLMMFLGWSNSSAGTSSHISLKDLRSVSHIAKNQPIKDISQKKEATRGKKVLFYGIILGVAVLLFGLWAVSLMSPTFDVTPTELGAGKAEKPLKSAAQQIGGIFEQ